MRIFNTMKMIGCALPADMEGIELINAINIDKEFVIQTLDEVYPPNPADNVFILTAGKDIEEMKIVKDENKGDSPIHSLNHLLSKQRRGKRRNF